LADVCFAPESGHPTSRLDCRYGPIADIVAVSNAEYSSASAPRNDTSSFGGASPLSSRVFREVSPHDRLGDERRPVLPLDLDCDVACQLQAAVDLIHLRQYETTA